MALASIHNKRHQNITLSKLVGTSRRGHFARLFRSPQAATLCPLLKHPSSETIACSDPPRNRSHAPNLYRDGIGRPQELSVSELPKPAPRAKPGAKSLLQMPSLIGIRSLRFDSSELFKLGATGKGNADSVL